MNLQENRRQSPNFRQIQLQQFWRFLLPVKYFGIFHGRLFRAMQHPHEYGKPGFAVAGRRVSCRKYERWGI
jgi:hypothetical protein